MKTIPASHDAVKAFPKKVRPTWEVAQLYPSQGEWEETDFLTLETEHRAELENGYLEFLPVPTYIHEAILDYLYHALLAYVSGGDLGQVFHAGIVVRLWENRLCMPDVLFVSKEENRLDGDILNGADLIMEVVSAGRKNRERDLKTKRRDYAKAGIPEYWIVDPEFKQISVLRLDGGKYVLGGKYKSGEQAKSMLLTGFNVDVAAALKGFGFRKSGVRKA